MDERQLAGIAARFGTPCYVFDEEALARRMREIRAIVGDGVRLCYSVKANPFLIPTMRPLTDLLEVCSPGELDLCGALGIPPDAILFSGVNKTAQDIARAMDAGVTRFTAESPLHVALLNEAAAARGRVYPVLLRLTAGSQFGMDESDLFAAIKNRAAYPGLRFEGIHYFAGTQRKKLKEQREELAMLAALLDRLKAECGFAARCLEYGPGLYFPYFAHEDDGDTLAPLRELAPDLLAMADQTRLTVEMGRFFVSECGTYLTAVADTKVNRGYAYAIVDGGIHHVNYLGGNMGMRQPRIAHIPGPLHADETPREWALCGSLCTTADVLVRRMTLQGLSRGDVLAFLNIGAYAVTEAPALFLSRDLPRVVLHGAAGDRLVRESLPTSPINRPHA